MPIKIVVNLDMDDVCFDWTGKLVHMVKQHIPDLPVVPAHREFHEHWDFSTNYPEEFRQRINSLWNRAGFYRDLEVMKGAKEAYEFLTSEGFVVNFVSSPNLGYSRGDCMKEKHESLEEHFGSDAANSLVLTHDKTIIMGDYLIDDKPDIKGIYRPTWRHLVFDIDYPYNAKLSVNQKINWDLFPDKFQAVLSRKTVNAL